MSTLSPATGTHGTSGNATLTGTNLQAEAAVNAGPTIQVSNVNVASATQIAATFTIASGAPAGATNATVTNAGGTSNPVAFIIK